MSFWIVRLQTRRPSLRNSARIRSAPHNRLSLAISINATVSAAPLGLAEAALDVDLQYSLNPWRCQRRSVVFLDNEERVFPGPNSSG
jgi:hypothetical protein